MVTRTMLNISAFGLNTARALIRYTGEMSIPMIHSVALGLGGMTIWLHNLFVPKKLRLRFSRKRV